VQNIDNTSSVAFLCLEIGSIACGYLALNAATASEDIRVLEASPVGSRFVILMMGQEKSLRSAVECVREQLDGGAPEMIVDVELISNFDPRVSEALFALAQEPLQEALVIVETQSVSGCLHLAQALVAGHGLSPIEIRLQRSSSGGAYGFFTGSTAACGPAVADARTRLETELRQGRVVLVENPSKVFRSYFQITGSD